MIFNIPAEVERLTDYKSKGNAQHAKQFEVDPGFFGVVEGNIQVEATNTDEENDPHPAQSDPYRAFSLYSMTHHAFYQWLVADPVAAQEGSGKQPVDYSRFPLDKGR